MITLFWIWLAVGAVAGGYVLIRDFCEWRTREARRKEIRDLRKALMGVSARLESFRSEDNKTEATT